jgi:calcium/calmodulin-dependent protein kinase I
MFATTLCGTPGYVAPEVLDGKPYSFECDTWSLGVIMFMMIVGEPPFFHEDKFELFDLIKTGKYDTEFPMWQYISQEAKDLLTQIFVTNPA